ncbi:MAG: hypothetical protein HY010_12260 [Acidobacteria bacterium]|nr:hypothetical protein [Acidobacteriota bacterium]
MKTWLRLTLILITVGGGFTGAVLTLQSLPNSANHKFAFVVFAGLYVFVTVSGLAFVNDPQRTRPLLAAIAIQIPWITSPVIVYKFAAGVNTVLSMSGPAHAGNFGVHFGWAFFLGSSWEFALLQDNAWGIGINWFALLLFILLRRSVRSSSPSVPSPAHAALDPTPGRTTTEDSI